MKAGFAHKRKFAKSNLSSVMTKDALDATWTKNSLNEKARAEDMTLDQWFAITAEKIPRTE